MNYNALALMGQDITDEDYAKTFDIPPRYIQTPEINTFMLNRQRDKEISYYESKGMSTKEATETAGKNMREAEHNIKKMMPKSST